ncbi:Ig-like domain-containing protein [Pantoea sp.]|uniref:Ig-like domain-containing protein n=1 Tax=Pantoea sp. TaxID=69393 RepID=UPI0031E0295E
MNEMPVSVAVIDNKTINKAEMLPVNRDGKPVKIEAIKQGKYLLAQGNEGVAPENITVKRMGNDLHVMLEGAEPDQAALIIEDFFSTAGSLVGKAEDGALHAYVATDGAAEHEAAALAEGEMSALALGEETVPEPESDYALAAGFAWSPALIALGGLAAIAAATGLGYLVAKHHYDDGGDRNHGSNSDSRGVKIPELINAVDDVGSVTGPIAQGGRTDDAMPTFNGKGTPGNIINVWDGATLIGSVRVGEDGKWSFTPEKALSAGSHSITTQERNERGEVSELSPAWEFTIDHTAPAKSILSGLVNDNTTPPTPIEKGGATNDTTPSLRGKAEASATIEIWDNGKLLGTALADAQGNWTFTTPVLAEGEHELSAIVIDTVGNKSLPSEVWKVLIDTVAPEKREIGEIVDSNGDPITGQTEDRMPIFRGKGVEDEIIKIIDNGEVIGSTIVAKDGSWMFQPETPIDEGQHEFQIIVTDPAGNVSVPSDKQTIIIDDSPRDEDEGSGDGGDGGDGDDGDGDDGEVKPDPSVPVTGTIDNLYKDNNSGGILVPVGNNGASNDPTTIIKGSGNPGDIVYLWLKSESTYLYQSVTVDEKGQWEYYTPELPEGVYQIEAAFKGADGVVSGTTSPWHIEIDVTPPPKPVLPFDLSSLDILSHSENALIFDEQQENSTLHDLSKMLGDDFVSDFLEENSDSVSGVAAEIKARPQDDIYALMELPEQY